METAISFAEKNYPDPIKREAFIEQMKGANASANLYSLIETAKANNIEPYRYLVALFKTLPLAQTADDYEALLPWNIELGAP